MTDLPAILGGTPIFDQPVAMVRPALPTFAELEGEIRGIVGSGMLTRGHHLAAFEAELAQHLGVAHAVCVSSCTVGLFLTYRALDLRGEVVVPSFTFMASVSSLVLAGLTPVFADVRRETTNLDPASAEAAITPRTTAIVAVHNFGAPAEIDALEALAKRRGLRLIFDAAHGFGARYRDVSVGRQGDAQVFSLSPTKLLVAGEGGVVSTDDAELARRLRIGREYGNSGAYDSEFAGLNGRMAEFNAMLGRRSLTMLEAAATRRNQVAEIFADGLGKLPGIELQQVSPRDRSSYKDYSIVVDPVRFGIDRDQLGRALAAERIDTRKYYSPPAHRQTAYRCFADERELPATEWLATRSLSLPIWSAMDDDTARGIALAVGRIHERAEAVKARLAGGGG